MQKWVSRWLSSLLGVVCVLPALAQEPPPRPSDIDRARKFLPDTPNLDDYKHWKTHRGKAEECLAVVRVRGEEKTVLYNALVVRCDGFLMVPLAAWESVRKKTSAEVVVTAAEGEKTTGPFPIAGANPNKSNRLDFHFLKTNQHHLRCLPLLAYHNLKEGSPLTVVWATLGADGKSVESHTQSATCGSLPTERSARCGLVFPEGKTPESLPPGAVVVDTESGAAVGCVPEGGKPTSFVNLRFADDVFAEAALAPTREAAQGKTPDPSLAMVRVPGKPLLMGNKGYISAYKTELACTPDFYCDTYLVTIGEWRAFLDFRIDRPLPDGWDNRNRANPPTNHPNLPVTGAIAGDMQDYATWRGKRLLTLAEWQLAAETSNLNWLSQLEQELAQISQQMALLLQNYNRTLTDRVNAIVTAVAANDANSPPSVALGASRRTIPVGMGDATDAFRRQLEQLRQYSLQTVGKLPGQVQEVGSRAKDKSDHGVFDMNLNAPEACLAHSKNYAIAPKARPAGQDPFISPIFFSAGSVPDGGLAAARGTIASMVVDDPVYWSALWRTQWGGRVMDAPNIAGQGITPSGRVVISGGYLIDLTGRTNLAFRCGR